jgi:hypothetical protein
MQSLPQDSTLKLINSMLEAGQSMNDGSEYGLRDNGLRDNGAAFEDPVSHGTEFIREPFYQTPEKQ